MSEQLYVNITLKVAYLERMYEGRMQQRLSVQTECPEGCWVEPGEKCDHGYLNPFELLTQPGGAV